MQFPFFPSFLLLSSLVLTYSQKLPCPGTNAKYPQLEMWNVDPSTTTVSGISNGGAFAVQISFIYSSIIHGAGIFAASPFPMLYLFAKRNATAMLHISNYYPVIDDLSKKGLIDSTDNLRGFKAYVYLGSRDRIMPPIMTENVLKQYKHYGADVKDMTNAIPSGHCVPTQNRRSGENTRIVRLQDVCEVGYQGLNDVFLHFYGEKFIPGVAGDQPTGSLIKSDISEFYPACNSELYGMSSLAWTYFPKRCTNITQVNENFKCKLHFAFHGYGLPFRARILANSQNAFVKYAGYLQAADANDVILIFPEARWRGYDILGYTGPEEYVRKSGVQNMAIKKMINRITNGT